MTDLVQNKRRALTGWPMIIGWIAMILFALHASTHMVGAGDTWVAMACGRHFINHGVNTVEPFSANSHRPGPTPEEIKTWPKWAQWVTDKVGIDTVKFWHPTGWVNQNWLTHVIFYWLSHLSPFADADSQSFNTLVYWKFAIYILTVICVYYMGRVLGVSPALSAVSACAAMFISRSFLDIRPAGFSNLLVAAFILTLILATYRNHLYIWLIVPMTVFWANLHGGYIYVFIALAPLIVLRLLTMLSKKTTVALHSILTAFALYLAMYKYTSHEPFTAVSPLSDKLFYLVIIFIGASVALTLARSGIDSVVFYGFHILAVLGVFLVLFIVRFFPDGLVIQSPDVANYVDDSRRSFAMAFAAAAGLGVVVTLMKERLILVTHAALWHTVGAGAAAFVASILFNPFHLTNLTHTFLISISANAEGWRVVHEWWPAFRWDNPVGTGFPFMVMMMAGGGLLALWLLGRLLIPKLLKGPKTELENQKKRFNTVTIILGYLAAVMICWLLMVSFSFTDVSFPAFLLCGLFVGLLWVCLFVNVHFIYLIVPFALFALYTANKGLGYTNRYMFPFIAVPFYAAMFAVGSRISNKPKYSTASIFHILAASVAAIILCAWLVNPFNFTKPVWHIEQFAHLHRMWQPPYEANLSLTYTYLFPILYGINVACVLGWVLAPYVQALFGSIRVGGQAQAMEEGPGYQLPKIDLALITIAAMTVYMAYRSRRFITIAAYVNCPIIAMFAEQLILTALAGWNYYRRGRLMPSVMSKGLQWLLTAAAAVVVTSLGVYWGEKFKVTYLDPSPTDPKLSSMFMRMTASAVKPFVACQFITANKLSGNMLNYWTEGGFVAWAQQPDPNTGKTPLQLFIDGRAQAAYNYDMYQRFMELDSGGETVRRAMVRRQELTTEDYVQIGDWVDKQLRKYNMWVVLMPQNRFDSPLVRGIDINQNWRLVFMDDKMKLYVDITRPRGMEIFNGIEDGSTRYPDECTRNIMIAYKALMFKTDPNGLTKGLQCAMEAYRDQQMRITLQMIGGYYSRYQPLRPSIMAFWKWVFDDYMAHKKEYLNQDGYLNRALGVLAAIEYLQTQQQSSPEALAVYQKEKKELETFIDNIRTVGW